MQYAVGEGLYAGNDGYVRGVPNPMVVDMEQKQCLM